MTRIPLLKSGVGSAAILTRREKTFSGELTIEDRRRLRHIVRKTHAALFAADPSDKHCDQVIDAIGPDVARKLVLESLASGKID